MIQFLSKEEIKDISRKYTKCLGDQEFHYPSIEDNGDLYKFAIECIKKYLEKEVINNAIKISENSVLYSQYKQNTIDNIVSVIKRELTQELDNMHVYLDVNKECFLK